MGIKIKTNIDFDKVQKAFLEQITDRVILAFDNACNDAIKYAGNDRKERYTDQTGALRSSTGYQLYKDGVLISEVFGQQAEGAGSGKKVASESAAELDAPIVAVIVAGMPYAIYVESKGKDVLTGATLQLPSLLNKYLTEAFNNTGVSFKITQ